MQKRFKLKVKVKLKAVPRWYFRINRMHQTIGCPNAYLWTGGSVHLVYVSYTCRNFSRDCIAELHRVRVKGETSATIHTEASNTVQSVVVRHISAVRVHHFHSDHD